MRVPRLKELVAAAKAARRRAYCPYSRHPVGAAVLGGSGRLYSGANVENASYGLSVCAERIAIFTAVAKGEKEITAVCVVSRSAKPCGACRQVMIEFCGKEAPMVLARLDDSTGRQSHAVVRVRSTLPGAFDPLEAGLLPRTPQNLLPSPKTAARRRPASGRRAKNPSKRSR